MEEENRTIDPKLGVSPGSFAERFLLADSDVVQDMWQKIQREAADSGISNLRHDYSENGVIAMAGRYLAPELAKPVYWAVRDNRVHFSFPFDRLNARDRMRLVNQVMVTYAHRSQKDDLKSVALAVSENGHFYIAMNTQERPTMDLEKECAESNMARIFKQISTNNERIAHMYVLGGLTDEHGQMQVADHLVGMCMRCVEIVVDLMSFRAQITVIPANDGKANIGLHTSKDMRDVPPGEAWQVPYSFLKKPSIISFSITINKRQAEAFQLLCEKKIDPKTLLAPYVDAIDPQKLLDDIREGGGNNPVLAANHTLEAINAFMVAKLAHALKDCDREPRHIAIAVAEVIDGSTRRYEYGIEMKGAHNASLAPVNAAVNHTHLTLPKSPNQPYINRVFVMGYNADGSPYDCSTEGWDRFLKRAGKHHADKATITFMPLNDGTFRRNDIQTHPLTEYTLTNFPGSKQHQFKEGGEGAARCC